MTINDVASSIRMKYNLKMGIDGVIEPIYFLITSIGFVILSFIQYKKTGKSLETIYIGEAQKLWERVERISTSI